MFGKVIPKLFPFLTDTVPYVGEEKMEKRIIILKQAFTETYTKQFKVFHL